MNANYPERENYLENNIASSEIINIVFDSECCICIRTILQQTSDQTIIQRCIDIDDETVNIALLHHDNIQLSIKEKIVEHHSHLKSELDDYLSLKSVK